MKVKKSVLMEALRGLGRMVSQTSPVAVHRSIRFVGYGDRVQLMATDGVEVVAVTVGVESAGTVDFSVEYRSLRELIRSTRGSEVEVTGERIEWPEIQVVPAEARTIALSENFTELLSEAAVIVNRQEARVPLQGIHLCREGIVTTDGKQLLLLPMAWELSDPITLPFPLALLTAKPQGAGMLTAWNVKGIQFFRIEIGDVTWIGKAVGGVYPNWRQVFPERATLDYSITFGKEQTASLIEFLKQVSDHAPFHGIELNVTAQSVMFTPVDTPNMKLKIESVLNGTSSEAILVLNKYILLRMLQQGYTTFKTSSSGNVPVIAEGGHGHYLTMPIRMNIQPNSNQEVKKMETKELKQVDPQTEPATEPVNPMEELNLGIDELRGKLKLLLDETGSLTRKVKEAMLQQKQKERDFILARRAIERIKMAI